MRIIRLTRQSDNQPIYINVENIALWSPAESADGAGSLIERVNGRVLAVVEAAETIFEMLRPASVYAAERVIRHT